MSTETKTKPAKIDASKENARKALDILDAAQTVDLGDLGSGEGVAKADFDFLCDFVNAAFRRLPSAAAIEKDKLRKQRVWVDRKKKRAAKTPTPPTGS